MHSETLLLDFMAKVNDALNSDDPDSVKLKVIRRAKGWAEDEYAKFCIHGEAILSAMLASDDKDQ